MLTLDCVTLWCNTVPSVRTSAFKHQPTFGRRECKVQQSTNNFYCPCPPLKLPTTAATLLVTYRASPLASAASTLASHVATLRRIKVLKKGPKINKTCYTSNTGITSSEALSVTVKVTVFGGSAQTATACTASISTPPHQTRSQ
jgi:hypothetical protein